MLDPGCRLGEKFVFCPHRAVNVVVGKRVKHASFRKRVKRGACRPLIVAMMAIFVLAIVRRREYHDATFRVRVIL